MVLVLAIAIGILTVLLVVVVAYSGIVGWAVRSEERATYRLRCKQRDTKHAVKSIEAILAEDWEGPVIDLPKFKQMWISLASHLEVDPERIRPSDRIADIMVATKHYGPDSYDLIEFIQDFLPHDDADKVLGEVAGDENESIGDLVRAVVVRSGRR